MLSVFLLLATIVAAYVVVVAGAVAFELTGLDAETSYFQALSAFTGTGFTTRAAERVVNHPVRRRIAMALILLGYAGTATVVASLVTSVNTESLGLSVRNLLVLAAIGTMIGLLLRRLGTQSIGDILRHYLALRMHETVPHEELLLYKRGFGISRIEVPQGSRVTGRMLADLNLRELKIQVLTVEDRHEVRAVPDPDWVFQPGQHVVLYGNLEAMREAFSPV